MSIKINTIIKKDLNRIEEIGKESLPIYYNASDLQFLIYDSEYILLKATYKKEISGFIVIKKYIENRYHIMSIAVSKNKRRLKIGSKLINSIKILYNKKISLYVQKINKVALEFYKKHHFIIIKELTNYYETLNEKNALYLEFNK